METPVYNFLKEYADSNTLRLHMPGHKGRNYCGPLSFMNPYDITEIKGADSLFEADGIISQSENNASHLYGTAKTIYSAGGSTLCIQTMLALVCKPNSTVIAPRNVHKAFINTCIMLDLDVSFIYPEDNHLSGNIISYEYNIKDIERAILSAENPSCVYITSPDYYGRTVDIKEFSALAHKYSLPLLVDNAHGAHLAFLDENIHPIKNGADMCCDSAHKMLPVLTGGAYLHFVDDRYCDRAKDVMALYGSTSPSYLIMCSLDLCNDYLENHIREDLSDITFHLDELRNKLKGIYTVVKSEPLHFTLLTKSYGYRGTEIADILRDKNIECEYSDENSVVLLFSPLNSKEDVDLLYNALASIERKEKIETEKLDIPVPVRKMSIRMAALSENEIIDTENSLGRICGITKVTCPPGIAIVCGGEVIDRQVIALLQKYGINRISVVKSHL